MLFTINIISHHAERHNGPCFQLCALCVAFFFLSANMYVYLTSLKMLFIVHVCCSYCLLPVAQINLINVSTEYDVRKSGNRQCCHNNLYSTALFTQNTTQKICAPENRRSVKNSLNPLIIHFNKAQLHRLVSSDI